MKELRAAAYATAIMVTSVALGLGSPPNLAWSLELDEPGVVAEKMFLSTGVDEGRQGVLLYCRSGSFAAYGRAAEDCWFEFERGHKVTVRYRVQTQTLTDGSREVVQLELLGADPR
jgi:hypothetical protein